MNGFLTYLTANVGIDNHQGCSIQAEKQRKTEEGSDIRNGEVVRYASRRKKTEDRRWYEV